MTPSKQSPDTTGRIHIELTEMMGAFTGPGQVKARWDPGIEEESGHGLHP